MSKLLYKLSNQFCKNVKDGKYLDRGIYWNKRYNTACYSEAVERKHLKINYPKRLREI